ncbi:MAG: hypothetical protein ABIR30_01855 [Chitinophagaceae bacterium]
MKLLSVLAILLINCSVSAQLNPETPLFSTGLPNLVSMIPAPLEKEKKIKLQPQKWKLSTNHYITGGLAFMAGASKGFNETLQFHWKEFRRQFPRANAQWFNPSVSWKNKYKNGDSQAGARYPLSTSVLIMFTDQYHLNNFFNKMSWTSALVIKIGEGKKPLKHYLLDFIYYTLCHQAGFALTYYPFSKYKGK